MVLHGSRLVFMVFHGSRLGCHGSRSVFMVFHGTRLVFHGFSWFFMFFHGFSWFKVGFSWFFMVFHGSRLVFHGFSWFQVGISWFFKVFHGYRLVFMVFRQNVPAQTVSWPSDPVLVRRPEGGIGPSEKKIYQNHCKVENSPVFLLFVIFCSLTHNSSIKTVENNLQNYKKENNIMNF